MRRVVGWRVIAVVVCLLAGFLFGVSRSSADGYDLRGGRTVELSGLVRSAESRVAAAQTRLISVNKQLKDLEQTAARSDGRTAEVTARARWLERAVGLTALSGPGMVVTLTDAPRGSDGRYPDEVDPDALVVHQQDVQSVLNGLWAGGADAIAVQDQRLITTSAVRCIGNTLLLASRTYSPPFVITAVGDPDRLRAALDEEYGVRVYRQYAHAYGLGYEVQAPRTVSVPAYAGSLRLGSVQEVLQ